EVTFWALDFSCGVLRSVEELISTLLLPQLKQLPEEYPAGKSISNKINKQALLDLVAGFNRTLSNSSDILEKQVLAISDQIRKETDDTGPRVELDYWLRRKATFKSLLHQMQNPLCKSVLLLLQASKSRLIKRWASLDAQVNHYAKEANDNVKFLYTLEEYCEPLSQCDPVTMIEGLPKLVNTIKLIYNVSTHYNTAEKITSLFIKVTNQMIKACKLYISNRNQDTIWTQPKEQLFRKLTASCRLNEAYQSVFHRVKSELEVANDPKKFDFSEIYIFGKFNAFCRRLRSIEEVFMLIERYGRLCKSNVEGLGDLIGKFNSALEELKRTPYNFLDQRQTQIDEALEKFREQINGIRIGLQNLFQTTLERIPNVLRALQVISQFKDLNIFDMGIESAHFQILKRYETELEMVGKEYVRYKDCPPSLWDTPPVAGKIAWARHLFRRIESPMLVFKDDHKLMRTKEAREITKQYNRLAETLVTHEVVNFRSWLRQIATSKVGLRDPLLVQDEKTYALSITLDPELLVLYREIDLLAKFGMEIPGSVNDLGRQGREVKMHYDRLKAMLAEISRMDAMLDPRWVPLMRSQFAMLQTLLKPGLTLLNWTSLGIDQYIDDVFRYLSQMELLAYRATNLCENRIELILEDMSNVCLCELPESGSWSVDYFIERTRGLCMEVGQLLELKSQLIQGSVYELIDMLCGEYRQMMHNLSKTTEMPNPTDKPGTSLLHDQASRLSEKKRALFGLPDILGHDDVIGRLTYL
ncbi:hypothetical protein PHET_05833, partial [Paragonimus heterotremus]